MNNDKSTAIGCFITTYIIATIIIGIFISVPTALIMTLIFTITGLIIKIITNKQQKYTTPQAKEIKYRQSTTISLSKPIENEKHSKLFPSLNNKLFSQIHREVRALRGIYDEMTLDKKLMSELQNVVKARLLFSNNEYNNIIDENKDTLKALMLSDFGKIYRRMGYNYDIHSRKIEHLAMIMFSSAIYQDLVYKTFDDIDKYGAENYKRFFDTCAEIYTVMSHIIENDIIEGSLSTAYLANKYQSDWRKRYIQALHNLFSAIISTKTNPTEKERNGIAYLKEMLNSVSITDKAHKVNKHDKSETDLQSLIGLDSAKKSIESLSNFIKIQQKRCSQGHKPLNLSYHCVFVGNPGTGKTTVARLLASIYKDLGVLKKGHLVEVDRSDLVAEYVGQTAIKTNKVIDSALDGILFIDEAYTLATGNNMDYGNEAIATLLKRMEDDRDRLVVILAGYPSNMHQFIDSNPGLQSRFSRYIEFEDYSAQQLEEIFLLNVKKNDYEISPEALKALRAVLTNAVNHKDEKFGNARYVRNLFEHTIERQANRLATASHIEAQNLSIIEPDDIPQH